MPDDEPARTPSTPPTSVAARVIADPRSARQRPWPSTSATRSAGTAASRRRPCDRERTRRAHRHERPLRPRVARAAGGERHRARGRLRRRRDPSLRRSRMPRPRRSRTSAVSRTSRRISRMFAGGERAAAGAARGVPHGRRGELGRARRRRPAESGRHEPTLVRHAPSGLRRRRAPASRARAPERSHRRRRHGRRVVVDRARAGLSGPAGRRVRRRRAFGRRWRARMPRLRASADRVSFHLAGGDVLEQHGPFDVAFAFECIHDMPEPVPVLRAMRRAVSDDGLVIIMDEAVGDRFEVPGDEMDAVDVRVQPLHLPAGLDVASAERRHRYGDAPRHAPPLRAARPVSTTSRCSRPRTSDSGGSTNCSAAAATRESSPRRGRVPG